MRVLILNDVISYGKNKTLYAAKGEILNVLNDKGDMLIVKGKKENFPINKSKVQII